MGYMKLAKDISEAKGWLFYRLPDLVENNLSLVIFEDLTLFANELPGTCKYWGPIINLSSRILYMYLNHIIIRRLNILYLTFRNTSSICLLLTQIQRLSTCWQHLKPKNAINVLLLLILRTWILINKGKN